jgi:2-polyprenyl-6-methoxyphenol hydroxylase-like FAD-dependent oxidoreductase
MKLDIAIVGYGTAGQAAAVLLERDGHRVCVFERAPQPGPVGAGFLLQPTGLEVLWRMGLLDAALAHGAPVARLYGDTPTGRAVMDMRYRNLDSRLFGLGMQRGALFELLHHAWEGRSTGLHAGTCIVGVDAEAGRLHDESGAVHGPFDLIVAADGAASRLRGLLAPGMPGRILDAPYPWGALWRLFPAADWPWPDELRQRYVAARKMIGLLPVGTRPGDVVPKLSFFWSLPVADFEGWRTRGLYAWQEEVAALWPQAGALLAGVTDADSLSRASYRDVVLGQWQVGRVLLLGDAAHAMSPQLGQGVNMALMDALALRDALRSADSVAAALAACQHQRKQHVRIYQQWSRWLTPLFQSEHDFAAQLRDIGFLPAGRVPGGKGHMLRVLSGTQHGLFGKLRLDDGFLAAMAARNGLVGAASSRDRAFP